MSGLVRLFALFSKLGKRASQTTQVKKGTHPQLKKGRKLTKSETPVKEVQTRPKQSLQGQQVSKKAPYLKGPKWVDIELK